MKILFTSNDGKHLSLTLDTNQNYYFLETNTDALKSNFNASEGIRTKSQKIGPVRDISELINIIDESEKEVTLISRPMTRPIFETLKKSGTNVYITFEKNIDDAVKQFFKNRLIHELLIRQVPSKEYMTRVYECF